MAGSPKALDAILRQLPLRTGLYVPDDLLQEWFDDHGAAQSFAARFECEFQHDAERGEGIFWKWVPAI